MSDFDFNNIPIVRNVSGKTLAEELQSFPPKDIRDVARGRITKPYPYKYDTFASMESLVEYVNNVVNDDISIKREWLAVSTGFSDPFDLRSDVYYIGVNVTWITCYEPSESALDDRRRGVHICDLNPKEWDFDKIKLALNI